MDTRCMIGRAFPFRGAGTPVLACSTVCRARSLRSITIGEMYQCSTCSSRAATLGKPTALSSWGNGRAEWEATAQRRADGEKAKAASSASQAVRANIQKEIEATKKQRRRAAREREYGRQLDRQREEIHPPHVLSTLATMQPPTPPNLRLPEAKPDPDREYPVQILPIRPYEKEEN